MLLFLFSDDTCLWCLLGPLFSVISGRTCVRSFTIAWLHPVSYFWVQISLVNSFFLRTIAISVVLITKKNKMLNIEIQGCRISSVNTCSSLEDMKMVMIVFFGDIWCISLILRMNEINLKSLSSNMIYVHQINRGNDMIYYVLQGQRPHVVIIGLLH